MNNITYKGVLIMAMPSSWETAIELIIRQHYTNNENTTEPPISIIELQHHLKDKYYYQSRGNKDEDTQ